MNVQQMIDHLVSAVSEGRLDPLAEVMVSAPMCCSRDPRDKDRKGELTLPVILLSTGTFPETHQPWMLVQGSDVWGQDLGIEIEATVHRVVEEQDPWGEDEVTPIFQIVDESELEEIKP